MVDYQAMAGEPYRITPTGYFQPDYPMYYRVPMVQTLNVFTLAMFAPTRWYCDSGNTWRTAA